MISTKTRREAAYAGESKYYTGRPCVHGHDSPRYTASGICCACNSAAAKAYSKRVNKTRVAKISGAFVYPAHPDDHAALLAYAQALDLQRGRAPFVPSAPVAAAPFDAREARRLALGKVVDDYAPSPRAPHLPKP